MFTEAQLESRRAACRRWRARNPEKQRAATKSWEKRNPEKKKAATVAYRAARPGIASKWAKDWRARNPEYVVKTFCRRHKIEFSWEEYQTLLVSQGSKCAICGRPELVLCIDHCHKTKNIRGLLCKKCNSALGLFNDSFADLIRAADYIRKANRV